MQLLRPVFAPHPKAFGRGPERTADEPVQPTLLSSDLKLFAATFLAGFLFVSILIG
ncbi:MAG: hypothetical protein ACTHJK_14195 [Sphingomicrobium sp.]|jgi:hypothetical protein